MEMLKNVVSHAKTAGFAATGIDERKGNVFEDRKGRDKVEVLEDEADFFSAEASLFAGRDASNVLACEIVFTGTGLIEETDNI